MKKLEMQNKTVLVTGASSGIGKATAMALATMGATVVMICRCPERGQAALAEITEKTQNPDVFLHLCDLSLLDEVRKTAAELMKNYPRIDVLINNAGILPGDQYVTKEGYEIGWVINYLSPFLLTNLLFENLHAARRARVINVASEAHRLGSINLTGTYTPQDYSGFTAYCDTKLATIMFSYELAKRLEQTQISVNCLHPGNVASNFGNNSSVFYRLYATLARPFMRSCEKGAETPVHLACARDLGGISGCYFKDKKAVKSSQESYNSTKARLLWEATLTKTGIHPDY